MVEAVRKPGSPLATATKDATAGHARIMAPREGGILGTGVRALAVALAVVVGALLWAPVSWADEAPPPPTTPTATTPDAPPPDPYHPPVTAKPKSSAPKRSAPAVVHSAPAVPTRSYSPPVAATAPVRTPPTRRVVKKKVTVHKARTHVVRRQVAPKPVKVTFAPFANLVGSADVLQPAVGGDRRGRYLWAVGLAFAVLAAAGLSLHLLSVRSLRVPGALR
jgi:hypothetical protein